MKPITITILLTASLTVFAESNNEVNSKYQQAIQQLSKQKISVDKVNNTPVNGIKEVVISSGINKEIVYMSADGQFMFDGKLMNLKNQTNLTEKTENSIRHELMTAFSKTHKSIDFIPDNMTDHITVFTDIDCGYCRKLHQEVEQFNEQGIGVSYLFFPRTGLNTASHQKAVNVWCATDQQKAMTLAKSGEELEPLMCPNPIKSQYQLGISAGIHRVGTPSIVLEDGSLIPGYLPADRMKQRIEQIKAQN